MASNGVGSRPTTGYKAELLEATSGLQQTGHGQCAIGAKHYPVPEREEVACFAASA